MFSDKFHQNISVKPPNRILTEALQYIKKHERALDLGCGSFRDTRLLLEKGFIVDAVDNNSEVLNYRPNNNKINFYPDSFSEFEYPKLEYDIVNAQYSLPFCSPKDFPNVWDKIVNSLKTGGLFAGQFFGPTDGFSPDKNMTFLEKTEVETLFKDFKIHTFVEAKRTSKTVTDRVKFWHIFDVIAEKL